MREECRRLGFDLGRWFTCVVSHAPSNFDYEKGDNEYDDIHDRIGSRRQADDRPWPVKTADCGFDDCVETRGTGTGGGVSKARPLGFRRDVTIAAVEEG